MELKVKQKVAIKGAVTVGVIRPDGKEKILAPKFDNTITTRAYRRTYGDLSMLAGTFPFISREFFRVAVGTGTTPFTRSSSSLASQIPGIALAANSAGFDEMEVFEDGGKFYYRAKNRYIFSAGQVVGNIAEVGCSDSSSGSTATATLGNLNAGTLIKDSNGDPVTVTIQEEEQLFLDWEFVFPALGRTEVSPIQGNLWLPFSVPGVTFEFKGTTHTANTVFRFLQEGISWGPSLRAYYFQSSDRVAVLESEGGSWNFLNSNSLTETEVTRTHVTDGMEAIVETWIYPSAGIEEIHGLRLSYFSGGQFDWTIQVNITPGIELNPNTGIKITLTFEVDWSET